MREAYFDKQFLLSEDNQLVGFCAGYDRCAEHEHGIKPLKAILNVPSKKFMEGVEDRLAKPTEDTKKYIRFVEYSTRVPAPEGSEKKTCKAVGARFVVGDFIDGIEDFKDCDGWYKSKYERYMTAPSFSGIMREYAKEPSLLDGPLTLGQAEATKAKYSYFTRSYWGDDSFCIEVWGTERVKALKEIYEAFIAGRCAVSLSGSENPFAGSGLCFTLIDKLSTDYKVEVLQSDLQYKRLIETFEATGIEKKLKDAGKRWYALSPRFDKNGELKAFLNPQEQSKYTHGWFSIEELSLWAEDKGPVLISNKAVA